MRVIMQCAMETQKEHRFRETGMASGGSAAPCEPWHTSKSEPVKVRGERDFSKKWEQHMLKHQGQGTWLSQETERLSVWLDLWEPRGWKRLEIGYPDHIESC